MTPFSLSAPPHSSHLRLLVCPVFCLSSSSDGGDARSSNRSRSISPGTPPPGNGWQMLAAPSARPAPVHAAMATPAAMPIALMPASSTAAPKVLIGAGAPTAVSAVAASKSVLDVAPVVVPTASTPSVPGGVLSLTITPQDINLRNALDRWLQQQGWQLAWKIDDDLPLEFNATFSGNFKSVLTQVMQATNHMRMPTRVYKHTNNVIRVVAHAANCQE